MNTRRQAEKQIRLFITKQEFDNKFKNALVASFDYLHLAAMYYLDFTFREPELQYYRLAHFDDHLKLNSSDIQKLAKEIDEDVYTYWQKSLVSLSECHEQRVSEYKKYFGTGDKLKHQAHLHGKTRIAHLNMISKDIRQTAKNLPSYAFSEPEDVIFWKKLSDICIPVFNDAFETHKEVFELISRLKISRKKRKEDKLNILGNVASKAVDAGVAFLGGTA